ncbi:hypothetical protein P7H20_24920 [Paenibacillus larvae]|nr:hypothetical protein [Paenibacillus larvae]MDT2277427.1 hypothetical protein [Paenibacillus larvae]
MSIIKNSTDTETTIIAFYIITTAGYQLDGPLVDYYELEQMSPKGVVSDERTFIIWLKIGSSEEEIDIYKMWGKPILT